MHIFFSLLQSDLEGREPPSSRVHMYLYVCMHAYPTGSFNALLPCRSSQTMAPRRKKSRRRGIFLILLEKWISCTHKTKYIFQSSLEFSFAGTASKYPAFLTAACQWMSTIFHERKMNFETKPKKRGKHRRSSNVSFNAEKKKINRLSIMYLPFHFFHCRGHFFICWFCYAYESSWKYLYELFLGLRLFVLCDCK